MRYKHHRFTKLFSTALMVLAGFSLLQIPMELNAAPAALEQAMSAYKEKAKLEFSAHRGEEIWKSSNISKKDGKPRSCTTCHGDDLTIPGKHARTGKKIEPMAPSVNHDRFTKLKKIKKWLKRNCKWTLGRVCTDQEKGDILEYLSGL